MADQTLVAGIPFPVSAAAATYFNSIPADQQAKIRAAPLDYQKSFFQYLDIVTGLIGDKTYQDSVAHKRATLGPLDLSNTPLAGPATAVNQTVSAAGTVGDFLGSLTRQATWIRIAEAVIGAALVVAALSVIAKPVTDAIPKGAL